MLGFFKALLLLILASVPLAATAQQAKFPERPIRLIIPFAAGGGTDIVARIVAQRLTETIAQPVIVEAKPGGGGAIAVAELMRAAPDGHVLLIATSSNAVLPAVAGLSWHPSNDFTPIAVLYYYPF
ncbi:MAG: Bug family tripartite tricarboxylate transporter substrate binding protein, partial [Betaproteobacteria bacterium]